MAFNGTIYNIALNDYQTPEAIRLFTTYPAQKATCRNNSANVILKGI